MPGQSLITMSQAWHDLGQRIYDKGQRGWGENPIGEHIQVVSA